MSASTDARCFQDWKKTTQSSRRRRGSFGEPMSPFFGNQVDGHEVSRALCRSDLGRGLSITRSV